MKLHEIKKDSRIYVAKKVPGKKIDELDYISYYPKKTKAYIFENVKPVEEYELKTKWHPENGYGVYSDVVKININGDKNWMGIRFKNGHESLFAFEEGDYIALVEFENINFFCNIPKDDY